MDKRKVKKFKRICEELAEFMEEVHETNPNIMLFVAGEASTSAMFIGEIIKKNALSRPWIFHMQIAVGFKRKKGWTRPSLV